MTVVAEHVAHAQARIRELIESGRLAEATAFARANGIDEAWVQECAAVWRQREAKPPEEAWMARLRAKLKTVDEKPKDDGPLQIEVAQNVSGGADDKAQLDAAIAGQAAPMPEPEPCVEARSEPEPQPNAEPDVKAGLPALLPVIATAAEQVEALNSKHAVINDYGSKCVVLTWKSWDVDPSVLVPSFQGFDDFRRRYGHRYVEVQTDKGTKREAAGSYWLKSPSRRTYEAVTFEPGECEILRGNRLNLWRGLAIKPRPGKCDLFRDHIYGVLADGDPQAGEYIERWLAWTLQNPGRPAEAVLVLQGEEGTGKTMVGKVMRKIFGAHGLLVSDPKHLTGAFSGHLHHCVFMAVEEAFWAGNVKDEGRLKSLITEDVILIEPKYVQPFQVRNMLHIMMSSNNDWVVPAGHGARRYAVFKVSGRYARDASYFDPLWAELNNGGIEALAHDLLRRDLGGWHPKDIYETAALLEQKAHSLRGLDAWIVEMLQAGSLPVPYSKNWPNRCLSKNLLASAKRHDPYTNDTRVVLRLQQIIPGLEPFNDQSSRGWIFPPLPECRRAWERRNGGSWDWQHPEIVGWHEPGSILDEPVEAPKPKKAFQEARFG